MTRYDPECHHRRSIHLKNYDYTQPGSHFITLCTHKWAHLFSRVVDGKMILNVFGRIVCEEWFRSADIRTEIKLRHDELVVMPNHIHGIVWIVDTGETIVGDVRADGRAPLHRPPDVHRWERFKAGF